MIKRIWLVIALTCAAVAPLALGELSFQPPPGHNFLHVNCPPGSHGRSWQVDFGKRQVAARQSAAERLEMKSRGLTAGHPKIDHIRF